MNEKNLGRLNDYLKSHRITQASLAEHCEIQQSNISMVLNGKMAMTKKIAKGISEVTGINLNWLLYEDGEMLESDTPKEELGLKTIFKSFDTTLQVDGEWMKPSIDRGDILALTEINPESVMNGCCYAFDTKNYGMLVRIANISELGFSLSNTINDSVIELSIDDINSIYRIDGLIRRNIHPNETEKFYKSEMSVRNDHTTKLITQNETLIKMLSERL